MDTKGQDLHTILRHIIEKTNFQGDPGAKQEVDDAFGRLFAETEDQDDADDADEYGPPANSAPVAEWRAWAVRSELRTESDAASMTKTELQALADPR